MTDYLDIPNEYRWLLDEDAAEVAASVGSEFVRELIELIGRGPRSGSWSGIRVNRSIARNWNPRLPAMRDDRIRAEFDGANHVSLAQRYGLTVRHIYRITRPAPRGSQADLFA